MNGSRLPHSLRLIILLLRVALGLNFFFLGWSSLFDRSLVGALGGRSLPSLYAWMGTSADSVVLQTVSAWVFLAIGACLIVGLITRLASILGIVFTLASFIPTITPPALDPAKFANSAVLVIICLLIIIFSNAGEYLGLDMLIHVHLAGKHK